MISTRRILQWTLTTCTVFAVLAVVVSGHTTSSRYATTAAAAAAAVVADPEEHDPNDNDAGIDEDMTWADPSRATALRTTSSSTAEFVTEAVAEGAQITATTTTTTTIAAATPSRDRDDTDSFSSSSTASIGDYDWHPSASSSLLGGNNNSSNNNNNNEINHETAAVRGGGGSVRKNPACNTYPTCASCSDAAWCHWCDDTGACHSYGSWYGCVSGSSCEEPPPPPAPSPPSPSPDRNDTSGCGAHTNCADCALHSGGRTCHWCAFDNACHRIGSVYGCVTGVDCYSNDRCKRQRPEPIDDTVFTKIGTKPLIVICIVASTIFCCSSLCCCIASGIKNAYVDLADMASSPHAPTTLDHPLLEPEGTATTGATRGGSAAAAAGPPPAATTTTTTPDGGTNEASALAEAGGERTRDDHGGGGEAAADEEYVRLVDGSNDHRHHDDADGDGDSSDLAEHLVRHQQHRYHEQHLHDGRFDQTRKAVRRVYNVCAVCYVFTLCFIGAFVYGAVRYFPKVPEYNICNNDVAWRQLIEHIATFRGASFDVEILASVSNPNRFDVVLDQGRGSFNHYANGATVGTYDIPPVTVESMSITDLLIVAHISPAAWDTYSLTRDYYQGKLVLKVDAQTTVRVPALANYSFSTNLSDIIVHVNEINDRHLCSCPDWSDTNATTTTTTASTTFMDLPAASSTAEVS